MCRLVEVPWSVGLSETRNWRLFVGLILALYWPYIGLILALYWPYIGLILALYWPYIGLILALYWPYIGLILALYFTDFTYFGGKPTSLCNIVYVWIVFSGNIMNEHNPPMMLPNGYVYGECVSTTRSLLPP